jgi:hypothetical protein
MPVAGQSLVATRLLGFIRLLIFLALAELICFLFRHLRFAEYVPKMPRGVPTTVLSALVMLAVVYWANWSEFDMYQLVPQEIPPYLFSQLPGKLQ